MRQAESKIRAVAGGRRHGRGRRCMARILRGEVRWPDLNPIRGHEQSGRRPVLILSHDIFNARSGTVIAIALTSQPQKAGFPLTLELKVAEFRKPTWAKISQIRTLSVQRIGKRLTRIPAADVTKVIDGLNEILGE